MSAIEVVHESHSEGESDTGNMFEEVEAHYKTLVAGLDSTLKGLKALKATVKRGASLAKIVEKSKGPDFGKKVVAALKE